MSNSVDNGKLPALFKDLRDDFNRVHVHLEQISIELNEISRTVFRGNGKESVLARLARMEERVDNDVAHDSSDAGKNRWIMTTLIASGGLIAALASIVASLVMK